MNDFPFLINKNEFISEIRAIMITNLGSLWKPMSSSINTFISLHQDHIEQLLNDRVNDKISHEKFKIELNKLQVIFSTFLNQFNILSHRVIINTSTQMVKALEQKVETYLLALLMPFTYVESSVY